MTTRQKLEQDLAYVKEAVERREGSQRTPLGIALIWASYLLVGFTWLDLQPSRSAWFLTICQPDCVFGQLADRWPGCLEARRI